MKYRKLLAICLACIMIISAATAAFADSFNANNSESITLGAAEGLDEDLIITRTVNGNNIVVSVTDNNGNLLSEATNNGSTITVIDYSNPANPVDVTDELETEMGLTSNDMNDNIVDDMRSITWGNWTSKTVTFKASGMTVAAIIAYLASAFVGVPLFVISDLGNVFLNFAYKYATVKIRMRTGTDSNYQYAQEEITVWGHNERTSTKYKVYGPAVRTQKKSLNS